MKKKLLALVLITFILFGNSVMAAAPEKPVLYNQKITVTDTGGRYDIGFINLEFKKDFLNPKLLPVTFEVQIYAEDGIGYIEFSPDTPAFYKQVHIRVDNFSGYLYDRAKGENIYITTKKNQILASHFSRYNWNR